MPTKSELLSLLMNGEAWKTPDLAHRLGTSSTTVGRLVSTLGPERVLQVGQRRGRRILGRRLPRDLDCPIPVYQVTYEGETRQFAELHPVGESRFWVDFKQPELRKRSRLFEDLPYFLESLRPAGFLGRLIPRLYPELHNPDSLTYWSADDALRYLTRFAFDGIGQFIVGDQALERYVASADSSLTLACRTPNDYVERAREQMVHGQGSSAAGEQAKFLVDSGSCGQPALVKFSPPTDQSFGRRVADLLVAEWAAAEALNTKGVSAATGRLFEAGRQLFYEVDRFDRTPEGRRGIIALGDLDNEFLGANGRLTWTEMCSLLASEAMIPSAWIEEARLLWAFGRLIGNSDMHRHNLSFVADGLTLRGLAPAYDMLPASYAPRAGHLPRIEPSVVHPLPQDGLVWAPACSIAQEFWTSLVDHPLVSQDFRAIAQVHLTLIDQSRALGARLPKPVVDGH